MDTAVVDGAILRQLVMAGKRVLEGKRGLIDALNVFPVPDGDTGTNMCLTLECAAQEVQKVKTESVAQVADAVALGSLMGARGNSGVILSQLFRGLAKGLQGKDKASALEFVRALQSGVDMAYRAVMKPVEGTILTVAREAVRAAAKAAARGSGLLRVMEEAHRHAEKILARTPDMLPVLKRAGVVDAGGRGFICILEGALHALSGERKEAGAAQEAQETEKKRDRAGSLPELAHLYCTEFLLKGDKLPVEQIRRTLAGYGDSVLVVGSGDLARVHVHTNNPGTVLEHCMLWGQLHDIKIDNMLDQYMRGAMGTHEVESPPPEGKLAVIAVSSGDGVGEMFRRLGTDVVVNGGDTMNPSAQEILSAIGKLEKARAIIILPNSGNVLLTAEQAREFADREIRIVPSRTIPEGLAAMVALDRELDAATNMQRMTEALEKTRTLEVTYALRGSEYDGKTIRPGDVLGMRNGELRVIGGERGEVVLSLLEQTDVTGDSFVSVIYGQDVRGEEAELLAESIRGRYPGCVVNVCRGGQPLYYYIISVA